jgi:hypothetical protein
MNNSEQIERLRTYEGALERYKKAVPYKSGEFKGMRPLGAVRRYTRSLISLEGDVVVCSLYGHKVVKYMPTGEIKVNMCQYNSASTREFVWNVCGANLYNRRGTLYMQYNDDTTVVESLAQDMVLKDGKILKKVADYTYLMNRRKHNAIKAKYAKFYEYLSMMGKMVEEVKVEDAHTTIDVPTLNFHMSNKNAGAFVRPVKAMLDEATGKEDLDLYYKLFIAFFCISAPFSYKNESFINPGGAYVNQIRYGFLDFISICYAPEVFDRVPLPEDRKNSNDNKRFITAHYRIFNQGE